MKASIPLNSSLCTDSHRNDIKDPAAGRDLLAVNRSYLYNGCLTNPKKTVIDTDEYITTRGDRLSVINGSNTAQIYHNGRVIADVLSLGVEDVSFHDKDDAVIDGGSLWTVQKTLTGYTAEQTDLQTQEVTRTEIKMDGVLEVRFIRNTHKVIARTIGGSIAVDGKVYGDLNTAAYMSSFSGEFTAVEANGKIYFGYNNPAGSDGNAPDNVLNFIIDADTYGWTLADKLPDQNKSYVINITVNNNVLVGSNSLINIRPDGEVFTDEDGFAMDLLTGVENPLNHEIKLYVGQNAYISGRGGRSINNASTAINVGSHIEINGNGVIQGGGGEGAGTYGGGGAGWPPGGPVTSGGSIAAGAGTLTTGGLGGVWDGGILLGKTYGGNGGNPGQNGGPSRKSNGNIVSNGRLGGNAIRLLRPALCIVNGPALFGGIAEI